MWGAAATQGGMLGRGDGAPHVTRTLAWANASACRASCTAGDRISRRCLVPRGAPIRRRAASVVLLSDPPSHPSRESNLTGAAIDTTMAARMAYALVDGSAPDCYSRQYARLAASRAIVAVRLEDDVQRTRDLQGREVMS